MLTSVGQGPERALSDFFGYGEEFFGVAADGSCEVLVGGGDEDSFQGGVVAGEVFF